MTLSDYKRTAQALYTMRQRYEASLDSVFIDDMIVGLADAYEAMDPCFNRTMFCRACVMGPQPKWENDAIIYRLHQGGLLTA